MEECIVLKEKIQECSDNDDKGRACKEIVEAYYFECVKKDG